MLGTDHCPPITDSWPTASDYIPTVSSALELVDSSIESVYSSFDSCAKCLQHVLIISAMPNHSPLFMNHVNVHISIYSLPEIACGHCGYFHGRGLCVALKYVSKYSPLNMALIGLYAHTDFGRVED